MCLPAPRLTLLQALLTSQLCCSHELHTEYTLHVAARKVRPAHNSVAINLRVRFGNKQTVQGSNVVWRLSAAFSSCHSQKGSIQQLPQPEGQRRASLRRHLRALKQLYSRYVLTALQHAGGQSAAGCIWAASVWQDCSLSDACWHDIALMLSLPSMNARGRLSRLAANTGCSTATKASATDTKDTRWAVLIAANTISRPSPDPGSLHVILQNLQCTQSPL